MSPLARLREDAVVAAHDATCSVAHDAYSCVEREELVRVLEDALGVAEGAVAAHVAAQRGEAVRAACDFVVRMLDGGAVPDLTDEQLEQLRDLIVDASIDVHS